MKVKSGLHESANDIILEVLKGKQGRGCIFLLTAGNREVNLKTRGVENGRHDATKAPEVCPFPVRLSPRTSEHHRARDGQSPGAFARERPVTCPRCSRPSSVVKSIAGAVVTRLRRCLSCAVSWRSSEALVKGSLVAISGQESTDSGQDSAKSGHPQLLGDLGGSASSLGSALPSQPPEFSSVNREQALAKRGRGDAKAYPLEFERLWAGCENRRGNKLPAFKAFDKYKPNVDLTLSRFAAWAATPQWQDGYAPHLSTWLNDKGWETEPGPGDLRPRNGAGGARDVRIGHASVSPRPTRTGPVEDF